jgi:cis-L-3-hydroxyproline dehydratase
MNHGIRSISAYKVEVPLKEGTYTMSGGRSLSAFDTTIVQVTTESGLVGWGEMTPLGASYLPAYPEGARVGIQRIATDLIGVQATDLDVLNNVMDSTLVGHPYVKSALDIACWDILGKAAGLPVTTLLGGRYGDRMKLYRAISHGTPDSMVSWIREYRMQGYRHFQLKVGADANGDIERIQAAVAELEPDEGLVVDANGGWTLSEAARVVHAVRDLDVYIEQPCRTYEECLSIRRRTMHAFVLDESIDSIIALQRALADDAMDCVNIKLSKFGGLTRARTVRDLCAARGVRMSIEDTACTDITASAVAHLGQSTPEHLRLMVTLANVKIAFRTATGAPQAEHGFGVAPNVPGLGMEPITSVLGEPLFTIT